MASTAPQPETTFEDLGLNSTTLEALHNVQFRVPSPIQAAFLPIALKGTDCIGQARTGTGKTAAFVIPILEQLDPELDAPQALILTPTRELSQQVADETERLSSNRPVRSACLVGGRPLREQMITLKKGVQIVIGTPGRVLDLHARKNLDLQGIRIVVLDEADRMLDIGFRPDIEKILQRCPKERQTMLLSATLPPPVERLARRYMREPEIVDMSADQVATDSVRQYYVTVDPDRKFPLLAQLLLKERPKQALVFTRTKRGADSLLRRLSARLPGVATLHGDLPQQKRERVMKEFRDGKLRLLIATDIAGRGLDVSTISHIINYDIPEYCDDYVHRVGRTGRLSSTGTGYAFTFVTKEQGDQLTNIEIRINKLLEAYSVEGFNAYRPSRKPKPLEQQPRQVAQEVA